MPLVRKALALVALTVLFVAATGPRTAHVRRTCPTPRWRDAPTPAVPGRQSALLSIAWRTPADAWAVGYSAGGPLVERWDGAKWSRTPTPQLEGGLAAVSAAGGDDAWAVGWLGTGSKPLIEHWDGTAWTQAAFPAAAGSLTDVHESAPDDVWAIGTGASVYHWDGSTWTTMFTRKSASLVSLAVLSPSDVWAVGESGTSGLAVHWNGKSWHASIGPRAGSGVETYFSAAAAVSPRDVWAVANHDGGAFTPAEFDVFVYRSAGDAWKRTKAPPTQGEELDTIVARSARDIFVTATDRGDYIYDGKGSLTWHWSGGRWHRIAGRPGRRVLGVALDATGDLWAVGSLGSGTGGAGFPKTTKPLIERYGCL